MTRMFVVDGKPMKTWNPYTGCLFDCFYCWARRLVLEKLQPQGKKYRDGFIPSFHPNELNRRFKPDDFAFVSDMGDITWARHEWKVAIVERVSKFPNTKFLFQSKDTVTFRSPLFNLSNIYLGTTIEANRDYSVGLAPPSYGKQPADKEVVEI